jgi:hypothetical protein
LFLPVRFLKIQIFLDGIMRMQDVAEKGMNLLIYFVIGNIALQLLM